MINVVPLNDDRQHVHTAECWCEPVSHCQDKAGVVYPRGPIVVHNAADCREQVERLIDEGAGEDKRWAVYED